MEARKNRTAAAVAALAVVAGGVAVVHAATTDHGTRPAAAARQPVAVTDGRTVMSASLGGSAVVVQDVHAHGSAAQGWDIELDLTGAASVPAAGPTDISFSRSGAAQPFLTATPSASAVVSTVTASSPSGLVTTVHLHARSLELVPGSGPVPTTPDGGEHAAFTQPALTAAVHDVVTVRAGTTTVTVGVPWQPALPTEALTAGLARLAPFVLTTQVAVQPVRGATARVLDRHVSPVRVLGTGLDSDGQGAPTWSVTLQGTLT